MKLDVVEYGGWKNCVRLSDGDLELIATTDVGPRIIRFGFADGPNMLREFESDLGVTGGSTWRPFGGHRLWHAPEHPIRTYSPDNDPLEVAHGADTLVLRQPPESITGIQKVMEIAMEGGRVRITHRLTNVGLFDLSCAPWCLTVMAPGGFAVFPQEPYVPFPDELLPARPLVLWSYTKMQDPRYFWGDRFIIFHQDPQAAEPQKFGMLNTAGWGAYALDGTVFIKKADYIPDANYPDFGCNWESYTNSEMLEMETLGPMTTLKAEGGFVEHVETWSLHKASVQPSEESIDSNLTPLLQ